MKHFGTYLTLAIVAFWLAMNGILVHRDYELRRQGRFKRGVEEFLGSSTSRGSWMSIFQGHRKVGYTGYSIDKLYAEEGVEYRVAVETLYRGAFPLPHLLGQFLRDSNQLEVRGQLSLDAELEPTALRLDIALTILRGTSIERSADFFLLGRRAGDRFLIEVYCGSEEGAPPDFTVQAPLEAMALSNGLTPSLPLAEYEPGKKYAVAVLDPLSSLGLDVGLDAQKATVEILEREEKRIDGVLVDVYVVETRFRKQTTRSWVTTGGEVLRQEIGPPFDLVLRKDSDRKSAARGFAQADDAAARPTLTEETSR